METQEGTTITNEISAKRRVIRKDGIGIGTDSGEPIVTSVDESEMLSVVVQSDDSLSPNELWFRSIMNYGDIELTTNPSEIQKVPEILRKIKANQGCFDPVLVSIGPYHHGKPELKHMEKFKTSLTRKFVQNSISESMKMLYVEVREVCREAKNCYVKATTESFEDESFSRMMFLDGCFLLQFMDSVSSGNLMETGMKAHEIAFVQRDLFLLENQLPFIVLEALMKTRYEGDKGVSMLNKFISRVRGLPPPGEFFMDFCIREVVDLIKCKCFRRKQEPTSPEVEKHQQPAHLVDILWKKLIDVDALRPEKKDKSKPTYKRRPGGSDWQTFRAARELQTAGIHFRRSKTSLFTDISFETQFHRAILRLPPITIDDSTKPLLLNLVAYEMCPNGPKEFGVTSYVSFMDSIIDHLEDVKELRKKGILLHYLGSDEQVADLFNKIAKDLVPNPHAYARAREKIQSHCRNRVKVWVNDFTNTHFSSPWTLLAFLAASLALLLSFFQTYYTIYPLNNSTH